MILKNWQNEVYIWALPACDGNKLYHFIVDSVFMFSTDDFRGALIDIICYYYVVDIQKLCMHC